MSAAGSNRERRLLRPGARLAVVAPCHAFDPNKLELGLAVARERGFQLDVFPDLLQPERSFAAPAAHQLAQLRAALTDPTYDGVWLVRGGSGMGRLLEGLDPAALAPRVVIGFSDATSLLARLYGRARPGWSLVHGPVLHSLPDTDGPSTQALFGLLEGRRPDRWAGEAWVSGWAEGPAAGGNLTVLASTCGTPWQVDLRGHVLFLEDIGEPPYRLERSLQQLADAGALDGLAAVAVGRHVGCAPPAGAEWGLREVYLAAFGSRGIPVVGELPFGHGPQNHAFRWGEQVVVDQGGVRFLSASS